MVTLNARVEGEKITLTNSPTLASGTVAAFQIALEFDDAWTGYGKIALFWNEDDEVYTAQVTDGKATIPHEVLTDKGKIHFGVYGTNGAKKLVTAKVTYAVADGAYTSVATESVEPTADLLDQIETALGQIDDTVAELRELTRGSRSLVALENYSPGSTYVVGSVVMHDSKLYECVSAIIRPEGWTPSHWVERNVDYFLMHMAADFPRFGVSGVGGSAQALTRLWDAAGLSAPTVGTDAVAGSSPFDNIAPFNRRKCVGTWSTGSGKAVFTVNAYYGDADYAEDGTMGDYVAVDVEPFYYYEHGGVLGVSVFQYPGYTIHPVCVDCDGNVRAHTYLPVYEMGLKDGKPVSLPGYHPQRGGYKDLRDYAALYTGVSTYAAIEPEAVHHYEWLLMTIEFATQNMQGVMYGAASMRFNKDDAIVVAPAANKVVVSATIGDAMVVGQTIYIGAATDDAPAITTNPYNQITAITPCNASGAADASGTYRLITYNGTDRTSSITANTTKICSRPWITGATAGYAPGVAAVLGHTGSPVNAVGGKYAMRYRWRENVYGNINKTLLDLADVRVEEDTDVFHLDWYFLPDPRAYSSYGNFTRSDLQNPAKGWVKLGVTTPSDQYVNAFIKELVADPAYPWVKVPFNMTGGGANLYYGDQAYLVSSTEVRAVRRGGTVNFGASAGPCFFAALNAPSHALWYYGAALFFIQ